MKLKYCCDALESLEELKVYDGKEINIEGCSGQCYALTDISYCPYCGTKLEIENENKNDKL